MMKKRLLSILLTLCLALTLLPVTAGAVSSATPNTETDKIAVTIDGTTTYYDNHAEGWNAAAAGSEATVILLADWTANSGSFGTGAGFVNGAILVPDGQNITLDLNGKTIDRALTQSANNGNVITVQGGLTIKDSSSTSEGTITGGYNKTGGTYSGGGILMKGTNPRLTLEGGNIIGNKSADWGGGVKNEAGTFIMTGGKISGNIANYDGAYSGGGGGVYAGVDFIMTGGEISGNFVCGSGDNRKGGGVLCLFSKLTVGGTAVIRDNKSGCTYSAADGTVSGGIPDNVYLKQNAIIKCTSTSDTLLTSGASIGVTTQYAPASTPVTFTDAAGAGQAAYFHSDNNYEVISTPGTGLQLRVTVPGAPTNVTATAGDGQATVSFTHPASDGGAAITGYTVTAYHADGSETGITATGPESPITVTGLTNGEPYTFTVTARSVAGSGAASSASNSVTPQAQETTPTATFTATGADTGTLSNVTTAMKYSVDGGSSWTAITGTNMNISGVTTGSGVQVYQPGNGTTTSDSEVQTITVTKAATPTTAGKVDCTTAANNNGKLTGVTASMEYKPSAAPEWSWFSGTGSDITGLESGTYHVRVKAAGTVLASDNQSLTIAAYSAPPSGGGGGTTTPPAPVTEIKNGGSTTSSNLEQLVSESKPLTVSDDNGAKLVFEPDALKGIAGHAADEIKVEIKDVSPVHQESFPGRQVFSLTVSSGSGTITNFGGTVTVSLPYTLKEGETADEVTVWHLSGDGTMTEIPCAYDPVTKLATFKVTHFSLYVVGTALWGNPFTDLSENDWFYDAVRYVSRNGLMQGTGGTSFSPNTIVTRGMLVTILWRLENEPTAAQTVTFSDVADGAWYAKAVTWAASKGIVTGYDGSFDPDGTLTREQMAAILYRYAAYKNYDVSAADGLLDYADKPSDWALSGVSWAVAKGLIKGSGNSLDPKGGASRAQAAALLQRFIESTAK